MYCINDKFPTCDNYCGYMRIFLFLKKNIYLYVCAFSKTARCLQPTLELFRKKIKHTSIYTHTHIYMSGRK